MQAIILAAGMGKRLKELTHDNTKCMVKVNGVTLIDRMLHQLDKLSLSRVVIVVGYQGQKLKDYIGTLDVRVPVEYIENPIYDKTNNIYSLALAKDELCKEDSLLFESDIIFEDAVVQALLEDPRDTLALVDKFESWMDGTCVKLAPDDSISDFIPGKKFKFNEIDEYYKTVNIYKFSKDFSVNYYVPFLDAYSRALGNNEYYEQVLKVITMLDEPVIKAKRLSGQVWYEIDDEQDLDIAGSLFAKDEEQQRKLISARYGGYWRYPKLLDFCYLVNPYFPPQKMKDEMKSNFENLLCQYPSGMQVNSLIAAKNFGLHRENVAVGNGAAELIKALMEYFTGSVGFIRPTFEEYPNRYAAEKSVFYLPDNPDYAYTAEDIMDFFDDKKLQSLVLVNPDNPSGNYIPKEGLLEIIDWAKQRSMMLVIDESFVDFAEEPDSTLLKQQLLLANPHLFVVKSISKSYGVPGIRLGILASGNTAVMAAVKKQVSIWNINSFGEFYLQIAEKYKKDYAAALAKLRTERMSFQRKLAEIPGIRVVPSQANYVMVELTGGMTSRAVTCRLLSRYNIFVKDLSGKLHGRQYLRLAVRNTEDNNKLIAALKAEMSD